MKFLGAAMFCSLSCEYSGPDPGLDGELETLSLAFLIKAFRDLMCLLRKLIHGVRIEQNDTLWESPTRVCVLF